MVSSNGKLCTQFFTLGFQKQVFGDVKSTIMYTMFEMKQTSSLKYKITQYISYNWVKTNFRRINMLMKKCVSLEAIYL